MATEPQLGRAARSWRAQDDPQFLAALAYMGKWAPVSDSFWADNARCRAVDPKRMFPEGSPGRLGGRPTVAKKGTTVARTVCGPCKIQAQCLAAALDRGDTHGVWGATAPEARRKMYAPWKRVREERRKAALKD